MKLRYLPLIAIASLSLLTGCGSAPTAGGTSTPAPSATAAPTPTATSEPEFAALTLLGERTVATDSAGNEIASIDYFDEASVTVATLTDLFGFEPTVEVVPPTNSDRFAGTTYDWEGLKLYWQGFEDQPESGTGESPWWPSVLFIAEVPNVGDVTIEGFEGVQVGGNTAEVAAQYPEYAQTRESQGVNYTSVQLGLTVLPSLGGEVPEPAISSGALGIADESITSISAPSKVNYGL